MDDYIKITVLENTIEAQLIDSILSEKNIPHRIRSFHDTAYDGLFQFQKGWAELYAPLKLKGEILEITDLIQEFKILERSKFVRLDKAIYNSLLKTADTIYCVVLFFKSLEFRIWI